MSSIVTDNSAGVDQSAGRAPPARSWITDFIAPYRLIFQPTRLGTSIRHASFSATLSSLLISMLLVAGLVVFLMFLEETLSHPSRSLDQVWQSLCAGPGLSGLQLAMIVSPIITLITVFLVSFLSLQDTYRDGSVRDALGKCFLMSVSALPFLMLAAIPVPSLLILNIEQRRFRGPPGFDFAVFMSIVAIEFWLIVAWMNRGLAALGNSADPVALAQKLCENCGYDITQAAFDSICPECGVPVRPSVSPDLYRRGVDWEGAGRNRLINSTLSALFTPSDFYRKLQLRTGIDRAASFAAIQIFLIGPAAAIWILSMICLDNSENLPGKVALALTIAFCAGVCWLPMLAWTTTRGIASIVALVWFPRGVLRDGRWLAKIVRYETVYVWLFCAFNGLLITSFAFAGNWIASFFRDVLNIRRFFFLPPETILGFGGNALLIGLWFLRYRTILRAIQHSNY